MYKMLNLRRMRVTFSFCCNYKVVVVDIGRCIHRGKVGGSQCRRYSHWSTYHSKVKFPSNTTTTMNTTNSQDVSFKFTDYDCIGFDLDNTICRYKVSNMVNLEYNCLANYLIKEKGYSSKYLTKPIEENVDFMLKGLILDVKKGNILRLSHNGVILHGSHGTKELTRDELSSYYNSNLKWHITDQFTQNPLCTWNGPLSENMRTLLDYFDMPAGLIFARIVDTLDEEHNGVLEEYTIYPDIVEALHNMFTRENFQLGKGGYFSSLKADPNSYIHKCNDKLVQWFHSLRKQKKILFLITGSNVDFASYTASISMGSNWRELFDIVVCFAKKPGFFMEKRDFIGLDGFMETEPVANEDLKHGEIYTFGNWQGLYQFLQRESCKTNPKVLYIGDNLIQDVYTPNVHAECDTVAVCEELEAEGFLNRTHFDKDFLISNTWGSYFSHVVGEKVRDTIWKEIINRHAKLCIPSLEYIAEYPVDFNFYQHTKSNDIKTKGNV